MLPFAFTLTVLITSPTIISMRRYQITAITSHWRDFTSPSYLVPKDIHQEKVLYHNTLCECTVKYQRTCTEGKDRFMLETDIRIS